MVIECKKALLKSCLGTGFIFCAILLVFLGRSEHFGYLDRHVILISLIALILLVVGSLLIASYLRCLQRINRNIWGQSKN